MRLVYAQDKKEQPPQAASAQQHTASDDDHWVIRPKVREPDLDHRPFRELKRRPVRSPASARGGPLPPVRGRESDQRPRRWLALGLAGMAYVVGIAGLWSMLQTFDGTSSVPVMPARESTTLPPLDKAVDIRDAHLNDGLIRPKFKPDLSPQQGDEVAISDLQDKI